jgi:hypothetical protein
MVVGLDDSRVDLAGGTWWWHFERHLSVTHVNYIDY